MNVFIFNYYKHYSLVNYSFIYSYVFTDVVIYTGKMMRFYDMGINNLLSEIVLMAGGKRHKSSNIKQVGKLNNSLLVPASDA